MPEAAYDVAIIGGGPAGLARAYHLRESGLSVRVLEATSDVGGPDPQRGPRR
jgi:protoporphyrinogen/coproporphyrinogen III oxidase